jgi:hypothetical protein
MRFVVEQVAGRGGSTASPAWRWRLVEDQGVIQAQCSINYASCGACQRTAERFRDLVVASTVSITATTSAPN